jgi:hypothetical protein
MITPLVLLANLLVIDKITAQVHHHDILCFAAAAAHYIDAAHVQVVDGATADVAGKHQRYALIGQSFRDSAAATAPLCPFKGFGADNFIVGGDGINMIGVGMAEMFVDHAIVYRNCNFHRIMFLAFVVFRWMKIIFF